MLKLKKISFKSRIVVTINSLVILASALLMPPTANAATVAKLGSKCTKLNEVQLVKSEILMCMTSTKGWTWQSMGSTSTTPTKTAQSLPLVLNMTRKEAAQIKTYISCLHTNGLPNIKTLADIWNIDLTNTLSKQTLDACQTMRPKIADKPANKYIPAQESSTKKEIKVIVIGNNPRVDVGNNFQCNTGLGNFSIKWGITAKPLYPAFIASMDGTAQSLAYFKATSIDSSTIKLDNLTSLAVGKYLTCIVADPPGSTYLGSASVLIPKTN